MIRHATEEDLPAILTMGRAFFSEAGWPDLVQWDEASVEATLRRFLTGEQAGALLVAEWEGRPVGMAAVVFYPFYFNAQAKAAQELFWYVDPEHRVGAGRALLDGMEAAAREGGAEVFTMLSVAGLRDDALARIYRRRGFRAAERSFIKRL